MANARYVPRGHIGSEQALVLVAKATNPDRWRDHMLIPKEKEIYEGLGRTLKAEHLDEHIRVMLSKPEREGSAVVERICDFHDAAHWLRRACMLAIFPDGTWTKTGSGMTFQRSGGALAMD
jgi:hypothetical protein